MLNFIDLIGCHTLINDDTSIGIVERDPIDEDFNYAFGHWFEDHILKYSDHRVTFFMCWPESNKLTVRVSKEV